MQLGLARNVSVRCVTEAFSGSYMAVCSHFLFHWTLWKHYWYEGHPSWEISQSCNRFVGVRNKALLKSHWACRMVVRAAKLGISWLTETQALLFVALQTLRCCYHLHDLRQFTAIVTFSCRRCGKRNKRAHLLFLGAWPKRAAQLGCCFTYLKAGAGREVLAELCPHWLLSGGLGS